MGLLERLGLLEPARDFYNRLRYLLSFRVRRENAVFLARGTPDRLPIPPPRLIHLIGGSYSMGGFFVNGRQGADCISRILRGFGLEMESFGSVLDFGCGCGRITRFWAGLGRTRVHGTDYNPELVGWCRDNLRFGTFSVNGLASPLEYPAGMFDFVYAVSVFTHLPADLQRFWMNELVRVTAPGGYLYITVLGTQHRSKMSPSEWERFQNGGMIEQWTRHPGTNICRVFHSERYFRRELASGTGVVAFIPGGAEDADHQDVFLLRKPPPFPTGR